MLLFADDLQEGSLCYMMQAELRENCECSGIKQIAALKKVFAMTPSFAY